MLRIRICIIFESRISSNEKPVLDQHESEKLDLVPYRGDADPQHWYRLPYPTDINYNAHHQHYTAVVSTAITEILEKNYF